MVGGLHTFIFAAAVLIYITSALRIAPPKPCLNGVIGPCIKGKCPKGGYCRPFRPGAPAVCCRIKPVCRYGSSGVCLGKKGPKCAPGSSCTIPKGSKTGQCCKRKPIKPPFPRCKYGQTGLCSRGRKCKPGSSCQYFKGPGPRRIGRCCRDKPIRPPFPRCPYGFTGLCGLKGRKCKPGSTCKYLAGPKGIGHCCRNKKLPGFCPPASPRPGICVFNPKVNCLNDAACPKGQLCCKEGCGKVCKKAIPFPVKLPAA